jgi:predicted nucleic acid-binding protein
LLIDENPKISLITKIELLCWRTEPAIESAIVDFVEICQTFPISERVVGECVKIRRQFRSKIPDAIIAATALVEGFTLVTNNTKDFEQIHGIQLINPHSV